jgi:hypothetical protein
MHPYLVMNVTKPTKDKGGLPRLLGTSTAYLVDESVSYVKIDTFEIVHSL